MKKKYNDIDDLFRDKFEDFEVEPPEYVWDNVKARMGHVNGGGSGLTRGGIAGLTILVIALGIMGFLFVDFNPLSSTEASGMQGMEGTTMAPLLADHQPEQRTEATPVAGPENNAAPEPDGRKAQRKEAREDGKTRVKGTNPKRNATVFIQPVVEGAVDLARIAIAPLSADPRPTGSLAVNKSPAGQHLMEVSAPGNVGPAAPADLSGEAQHAPAGPSMTRGETTSDQKQQHGSVQKKSRSGEGPWALGIYFTPEMITYPSDDQLKNYSYSIDLHASRRLGNYFLQSGLGVSRNQDQGNSLIDYNKYLGSYEDVYDVTFDSTETGIVPIFHTETVMVYDSVGHVTISPTKRSFTYLQVPLFIGYGEQSRRLGWFVKGGPSLSFLIHENIPAAGIPESQARILNVENELPGRISTHWQFIVSAGVNYKLGSRMSLSMEPMFRYYINSVYEQEKLNTRHPFSVGLRTGLLLNF